jgi:hypothetical protein
MYPRNVSIKKVYVLKAIGLTSSWLEVCSTMSRIRNWYGQKYVSKRQSTPEHICTKATHTSASGNCEISFLLELKGRLVQESVEVVVAFFSSSRNIQDGLIKVTYFALSLIFLRCGHKLILVVLNQHVRT